MTEQAYYKTGFGEMLCKITDKLKRAIKPQVFHPRKIPFEWSKIDEYVYIGTNQCCKTHFDESLIKEGILADISLEEERIDAPWGVDYFLWLPTKNHYAPTPEQLKLGVEAIASLVKNKQKVFLHCQRGHGRAPTLASAYYISKGMSVEEALKKVKAKRPIAHLTERQFNALKKFRQSLKRKS